MQEKLRRISPVCVPESPITKLTISASDWKKKDNFQLPDQKKNKSALTETTVEKRPFEKHRYSCASGEGVPFTDRILIAESGLEQ